MAIEKFWPDVPVQVLSLNGGKYGQIKIPSTVGIKVKQRIILFSNTQAPRELEVKRVLSETDIEVGQVGPEMKNRSDLTLFLTSDSASLFAKEQPRPAILPDQFSRAVYEEEPAVAIRTLMVDILGRYIDSVLGDDGLRRLAVDAAISVTGVDVDLDALTPPTRSDPDNVLIAGSEDGTKTGTKHAIKVAPDGTLQTIQLFTLPFDAVTAMYPSVTQEIYQSRVGGTGGTVQETVTINYTDATKNYITDVSRI